MVAPYRRVPSFSLNKRDGLHKLPQHARFFHQRHPPCRIAVFLRSLSHYLLSTIALPFRNLTDLAPHLDMFQTRGEGVPLWTTPNR